MTDAPEIPEPTYTPACKVAYLFDLETGVHRGAIIASDSPARPGEFTLPAGATLIPPPYATEHERVRWTGEGWAVESLGRTEAHAFDPATGIYQGTFLVRESPAEPGKWLLPLDATLIAPPPQGEGERARWTGEGWAVEPAVAIAHGFDPETGFYRGPFPVDGSPLEPGVWLLPPNSTLIAPPETGEGEGARWTGEAWVVEPVPVEPPPPPPPPEVLLAVLRIERTRRLAACDWTQLVDAPLSDTQRAAWRAYRQALRDITETTTDLANPVWPVPPS